MSLIEKAYNPEEFRNTGHKLVDRLADYLSDLQTSEESPVYKRFEPDDIFESWQETLSPSSGKDFSKTTQTILEDSIHLHHPGYMGHQVSPVLPKTALADLLSAFMNNGVGVYEMGSPTVAMERVVIKQLAGQLGFDDHADGILTSGGTLGNLTALLAAREIMTDNNAWDEGTQDMTPGIMVSEQAHYSVDRAARIMGWGKRGVVKVPVDQHFRMDSRELASSYKKAKKEGIHVISVVGSACSTATGAFDPLGAIADFCHEHDLWFHVDAAHGGAAAYSSRYRPLLDGIQRADSVIVDFHKMMMCPALVTGLVFRNGSHSYQSFNQQARYLWEQEDKEWFNLGKRTFECTKDMMALKVYLTLQEYGAELFEEIVDTLFNLGKTFARMVRERDEFELILHPECNIVCFRHIPQDDTDINTHNRQIRRRLIDEGTFFLVQTELEGNICLRTTLMNAFTTSGHLKALLDRIEHLAA